MSYRRFVALLGATLVVLLMAGAGVVVRAQYFGPMTITAYFANATGIYPGDEVRVSGVTVGTIASIDPDVTQAKLLLKIDRSVSIPADAKAVVVAQNLISARYVQLAPAYRDQGPTMADGSVIPLDRTAIPIEWDQVKDQLTRLATELGPQGDTSGTSVSRFIDSTANALGSGNGDKLRQTLSQLAGLGRILSQGSGNLTDTVKNLATFIGALRDSNTQIVQFQGHLATLTSVIDGSRTDLDSALRNVSEAVGEVQRFIRGTRDQTAEQIQRMANITQNLVDHRKDLEQVLHIAPTAFANQYNIFDPRTGGATGIFTMSNLANPTMLLCGMIGAIENTTATESGKLCAQYLSPALNSVNLNYLPFPLNPLLTSVPPPEDLIYSEPGLAPGGAGGKPEAPENPPAVSAFTGTGDVAPPPGYSPPTPSLRDLILPPVEAVQAPTLAPLPAEAAPSPGRLQPVGPVEGTPPA
jgi:phospholipid/cholesterol/gamma-HCH transport system substrate-binding protein